MKHRVDSVGQSASRMLVLLAVCWLPIRAHAVCVGDCNEDGEVTVDELLTGVNITLEYQPLSNCLAFDADGSGSVEVNELIAGVNNALNGCPVEPTATPTSSAPMATATATEVTTPVLPPTETPTPPAATTTDTPTQATTPTPTPTATVTAQATASPGSPAAPLALGAAVVTNVMGLVPHVVAGIIQGVQSGGGSSAAALDAGPSGSGAGMCPLGGTATSSGNFPPLFGSYTATLTACKVATADGTVTFDGTATLNAGSLTTLGFSVNIQAVFDDAAGMETLRATAMFNGSITPSLGGSCVVSAVTLTVTSGTLLAQQPSGAQIGLTFQNTNLAITNVRFNTSCVPVKYLMTLNGQAALLSTAGTLTTAQFNNLMMDVDASGNPALINLSGGMTTACFGGAVTVATNPPLAVPSGGVCPTAGVITVSFAGGTAHVTYLASGSVAIDANGDGTPDQTAPNCLDPSLAMCLG